MSRVFRPRRGRTLAYYQTHPRAFERDYEAYESRMLDRHLADEDESRCPTCGGRRGLLHDEWCCPECDSFDASGEGRAA